MPPTTLPKTERHQASTKAIKRQSKKTEKKTENMKMILFKAPEIIKKQVEQCFLMSTQ